MRIFHRTVSGETHQKVIQERVEDRFELIDIAGPGFFRIVIHTLLKSELLGELSLLVDDLSNYAYLALKPALAILSKRWQL
jgi:hypothetical protein